MSVDVPSYRQDFEEASQEVQQLYLLRYVWKNVSGMAFAKPGLFQSALVYGYLNATHSRTVAIGVRRQAEEAESRATIGSLLRRIEAHSAHLTRDSLGFEPVEDVDTWVSYALNGSERLDPTPARQHMAKVQTESRVARRWANKRVAHLDRQPADLTFGELDEALTVLGEATRWLFGLFNNGSYLACLTPVADPRWMKMFSEPWLDLAHWTEVPPHTLG